MSVEVDPRCVYFASVTKPFELTQTRTTIRPIFCESSSISGSYNTPRSFNPTPTSPVPVEIPSSLFLSGSPAGSPCFWGSDPVPVPPNKSENSLFLASSCSRFNFASASRLAF